MPISTTHTHNTCRYEAIEFQTYLPTRLYPNKSPGAILGHHLQFTQILNQKKVNKDIGSSNNFHITIHSETSLESVGRNEARGACIDAPITPNFPFGSSREIVGDYVKK